MAKGNKMAQVLIEDMEAAYPSLAIEFSPRNDTSSRAVSNHPTIRVLGGTCID